MRCIDANDNEVLYVSPWIKKDRTILAWATVLRLSASDIDDITRHQIRNVQPVQDWLLTKDARPNRHGGEPGGPPHNEPEEDQGATGKGEGGNANGINHVVRAMYPSDRTTKGVQRSSCTLPPG